MYVVLYVVEMYIQVDPMFEIIHLKNSPPPFLQISSTKTLQKKKSEVK